MAQTIIRALFVRTAGTDRQQVVNVTPAACEGVNHTPDSAVQAIMEEAMAMELFKDIPSKTQVKKMDPKFIQAMRRVAKKWNKYYYSRNKAQQRKRRTWPSRWPRK